jgi:hypothetical protein
MFIGSPEIKGQTLADKSQPISYDGVKIIAFLEG